MTDRSRLGFRTPPTTVDVDAWRVKLFCQAIGETNPVHWDAQAARAAGLERCPVPPTFIKALEGEHFSSAALMQMLQVPLKGVLHAEQRFEIEDPVHVGDALEISRHVSQIFDRKEGQFTFIVVETDYRVGGRRAARSEQTILVRNALAAA